MNSKLSTYLNVALVIAVAILYYLHFSNCNKSCSSSQSEDSTSASKPLVMMPKVIKASKVVYVNVDVLNQKYDMLKDLSAEMMGQQQRLESVYQGKAQKLQQDYAELQQKASQGLLSENQSAAAQKDILKRKEELDKMEAQLQALVEKTQKKNEEVRKTILDYLNEYNKNSKYDYILTYTEGPGATILLANDSLNITNEVLEGLNAQYKSKNAKK
jgi:outer membrane protein